MQQGSKERHTVSLRGRRKSLPMTTRPTPPRPRRAPRERPLPPAPDTHRSAELEQLLALTEARAALQLQREALVARVATLTARLEAVLRQCQEAPRETLQRVWREVVAGARA